MPSPYIPAKKSAFFTFASNFNSLLTAAPAAYGLSAGDATVVSDAFNIYAAAYGLASSNSTRTPVTVAAAQVSTNSLKAILRGYSRLILANAGVSDGNKTALGLNIHDTLPTPIPVPGTSPVLALVGLTPGQVTLTFRDTGSSLKSRSKPAGVTALELHVLFGSTAPATPGATPYFGLFTRSPFAITIPGGSDGQTAFIYGRWLNGKGQAGPWSAMLSTTVAE